MQSVEWDDTHGLVKINPLAWWSRERVLEHLAAHDLPYNRLLDEGYASVGCQPCTSPSSRAKMNARVAGVAAPRPSAGSTTV